MEKIKNTWVLTGYWRCNGKWQKFEWHYSDTEYEFQKLQYDWKFFQQHTRGKYIHLYCNGKEQAKPERLIQNSTTTVSKKQPNLRIAIVQVLFGSNSTKLYDYHFVNYSGHPIHADQQINLMLGTHNQQQLTIKHLRFEESIPVHVTKKLILQKDGTAFTQTI